MSRGAARWTTGSGLHYLNGSCPGLTTYGRAPRHDDDQADGLLQITHNEFPPPRIPIISAANYSRPSRSSIPTEALSSQGSSSPSSQVNNKENAPPRSPPRPPVPAFSSSVEEATSGLQAEGHTLTPPDRTLPPELLVTLKAIRHTLTTNFPTTPPYTIQRLAELILRPRAHYRALPSYLRALDRVVSVSSTADIFPLAAAAVTTESNEGGLLNGTGGLLPSGASSAGGLGSDESLGGALLTPIPWLLHDQQGEVRTESTEIVDGPNGAGSIETVSVSVRGIPSTSPRIAHESAMREAGAVTQGELLRQEQEAGVVPVAHITGRQTRSATARGLASESHAAASSSSSSSSSSSTGAAVEENEHADEDEGEGEGESEHDHPHARGPDLVGVEDMGPQGRSPGHKAGFDVEAALGRSVPHMGHVQGQDDRGEAGRDKDATMAQGDDDAALSPSPQAGVAGVAGEEARKKADDVGTSVGEAADIVLADADAEGTMDAVKEETGDGEEEGEKATCVMDGTG
ncbi:MAG: hypothetical protein M1838_004017 [Thelocarpon superellum]|nr:MAG: hypothetical protein M1838_004017 [Thelocarpon superellum]